MVIWVLGINWPRGKATFHQKSIPRRGDTRAQRGKKGTKGVLWGRLDARGGRMKIEWGTRERGDPVGGPKRRQKRKPDKTRVGKLGV